MEPIIVQAAFAKIGIKLTHPRVRGRVPVIQTANRSVPVSSTPGWGKDYADPSTFMVLFDIRVDPPERERELLPRRPDARAGAGDRAPRARRRDPERRRRHRGVQRAHRRRTERLTAGDLDQKLMEEVVPWVPYLTPRTSTSSAPQCRSTSSTSSPASRRARAWRSTSRCRTRGQDGTWEPPAWRGRLHPGLRFSEAGVAEERRLRWGAT